MGYGMLYRRKRILLAFECVSVRFLDKLIVDGAAQSFGKAHRRCKAVYGNGACKHNGADAERGAGGADMTRAFHIYFVIERLWRYVVAVLRGKVNDGAASTKHVNERLHGLAPRRLCRGARCGIGIGETCTEFIFFSPQFRTSQWKQSSGTRRF